MFLHTNNYHVLQLCIHYLTKNLVVSTACETMQAAVTYGQDELRRNVIGFIELHTQVHPL